uniref:Ovule protein n=1 Tax=Caenorhabditis tropicalis TaxID=1561998 RepID=A0A1I7TTU0_9PELO
MDALSESSVSHYCSKKLYLNHGHSVRVLLLLQISSYFLPCSSDPIEDPVDRDDIQKTLDPLSLWIASEC